MGEPLQRVARAIELAADIEAGHDGERFIPNLEEVARAAVDAIAEPTVDMIEAGGRAHFDGGPKMDVTWDTVPPATRNMLVDGIDWVYRAMIRRILDA